ncbi:MAG: hypothetical protein JWR88_1186 [Pseudonocardia sp.]|nr:hypothetical protein [Pseudonocardia sp.]
MILALVGGIVVWRFSAAAATTSVTAPSGSATLPAEPTAVPTALTQLWRAPSSATPAPVTVNGVVVTGDSSEVLGRDAVTGEVRWRYARDLPLCTVGAAWGRAVAVFRRGDFCSEVTTLDGVTGSRGAQRNADLGLGAELLQNDTLMAATTSDFIEVWRSDLVKTTEYGNAQAPEQPDKQPRVGCRYSSVAITQGRLGVVEHCPRESADRLTVLKPDSAEADKPQPEFSTLLPGPGAQLVALTADRVAVALPGPPQLLVLNNAGVVLQTYPLPAGELAAGPPGTVATVHIDGNRVYWWTGVHTVALDRAELRPVWTISGTLGTGLPFAGSVLIPAPAALLVVDPVSGKQLASLPVDRQASTGPIGLSRVGPVVLEQRGGELVALR